MLFRSGQRLLGRVEQLEQLPAQRLRREAGQRGLQFGRRLQEVAEQHHAPVPRQRRAGEAGIRSGGNILINAQAVRNASDIRAGGSAQGVPQLQVGNLASALASSNSSNPGKAAEDSAKAAGDAARKAAAAAPPPRPTILSVEVLGFGDKNCKEDDKECFAK